MAQAPGAFLPSMTHLQQISALNGGSQGGMEAPQWVSGKQEPLTADCTRTSTQITSTLLTLVMHYN